MLILLGSQAAQHHVNLKRDLVDHDLLGKYSEVSTLAARWFQGKRQARPINGGKKMLYSSGRMIMEAEIAWPGSTAEELMHLVAADPRSQERFGLVVPSLDVLYMLKMSHRYLKNSPHFLKTMRDIQLFRRAGAIIRPEHEAFLRRREAETYDYKHPSLMRRKDEFFSGDGVAYVYDHDSIHEVVALPKEPAYRLFQRDGAEVAVDRAKWDRMDYADQLRSVYEEATVLALERSQIPHFGKVSPAWSFEHALMKVCTSITSGWWREFAWENYDAAMAFHNYNYADVFWNAVWSGRVKKHAKVPVARPPQ